MAVSHKVGLNSVQQKVYGSLPNEKETDESCRQIKMYNMLTFHRIRVL